jgi:hypothetical protein
MINVLSDPGLVLLAPFEIPATDFRVEHEPLVDEFGQNHNALAIHWADGSVLWQLNMWVTPHMSEVWLGRNAQNFRAMRGRKALEYSRDMKSGDWAFPVDSIDFDGNRNLVNGQHRLRACILSGVPFFTRVQIGLKDAAIRAMDRGMKRGLSDTLRAGGVPNSTRLASIIRLSIKWQNGKIRGNESPTDVECMAWFEENAGIVDVLSEAMRAEASLTMKMSVGGAFLYRIYQVDPVAAERFVSRLIDGSGLSAESPILRLRFFWQSKRGRSSGNKEQVVDLATCILHWNKWIQDTPMLQNRSWNLKQRFPELTDANGRRFEFGVAVDDEVEG